MLIFRFLISVIIWVFIWLPFYFIGFFVTWLGLLFCNRDSEHMPVLWWPWDNSHGINGTIGNNNLKWVYLCNKTAIDNVPDSKKMDGMQYFIDTKSGNERKFNNRWTWVTWRNPVSNLSLFLLGLRIYKPVVTKNYNIANVYFEKVTSGHGWFYSVTIKYNTLRGFYFAFGWKFLDPADNRARFIFRISPYRELPKSQS